MTGPKFDTTGGRAGAAPLTRAVAVTLLCAAFAGGCYSKTVKAKGLGAREAHPVVSEPDAPGKKSPFGFTEDF